MKYRFFLIFIAFIFVNVGFGQINQTDSKGNKQGEWIKHYDNSKVIRYKGQFINDKPVCKFVYYYPNQMIKAIIIHDDSSNRSEAYMYYDNKKLMAFGIYINEEKDSVWTHYDSYEVLNYKETFKNGKLHGKKTLYYPPSDAGSKEKPAILKEINYENGELNGVTTEYFPDGKAKRIFNYKDGFREGKVEHFHPGGRLHIVERWKDRKKHGWWITYDESGKELGRKFYFEGEELQGEKLKKKLEELKSQRN